MSKVQSVLNARIKFFKSLESKDRKQGDKGEEEMENY